MAEMRRTPEEVGGIYAYCVDCGGWVELPDFIARGLAAKFVEVSGTDHRGHVILWTDDWEHGPRGARPPV